MLRAHYARVFGQADNTAINGNAAAVIILDQNSAQASVWDAAQKLALAQKLLSGDHFSGRQPPSVLCFTAPKTGITECFSAHSKIQLCGHGTLASLALVNSKQINHKKNAAYQFDGKHHWLRLDDIHCEETKMPAWVNQVFSQPPNCAAIAGDSQGYLILEWDQAYALQDLTVNFATLTEYSNRAVIATQACTERGLTFSQRYFAPQHGINEDHATGSAHRVLASYWQDKTGASNFSARQLSSAGGLLHSRIELTATGRDIWIGGEVAIGEPLDIDIDIDNIAAN